MSITIVRAARSIRPRQVFARAALIAISVIVASCNGDATGPGAVEPPAMLPKEILSTLLCKATPSTQTLSCSETPDVMGSVLPSYMLGVGTDGLEASKIIIGGQNTNIKLTSSNVVNNATTHDFSFDVSVKNLRPQAIGTSDGATTDSSLSVFFYSGPTTTGGSGVTTVSNPSGTSSFTGPTQPYFQYKEMVAQNATSSNKNWILHYDPTVTSFSFLLLVSANVHYPQGYIDVFPNPGAVSVNSTLQMTDSVRDALGYLHNDQTETWSLSDSTRASIDSNGLLTGLANGSVVVTAAQGPRSGSATITVSGGVTPTAVVDSSAANSAPGSAYHTALNTQYVLAAPGILSNDTPGNPAGTVGMYGADSLGGVVTDHAAGSTVSPLPGHADGSLTVNSNGAVTFTPPTDFTGYYAFHYRNTNSNGSTTALVRIAVGVRPSAGNSAYSPNLLGNVKINTLTSTNTKVNSAGDKVVYHFVSNTNGTGNVHADGTYDFNPAVGYTGPATLVYNVSNGFGTSSNGTVSFTVASRVWFVADSAGGTGDGRYGSPLKCIVGPTNCLSGVTLASNDIVHIAPATYANASGLTLLSGMKVIGQGASGVFADATNANVTWPADAGAQPGTAGTRPVINSSGTAVFVGGGSNLIRGVLIGSSTQASLSGSTNGGMTVGSAAIVNPSGGAVLLTFSGGTVTINLDSIVATGGTNGINLHKQSGNFTTGITRINNPSGTAITVDSSGAISLGTAVVKKTTTSGIGVNLLQNTSTTFGSLVDSTSVGPTMLITNGGTVTINGGILNSVGGIGIDATNTVFAGTGFSTVNVSGAAGSGINLNSATGTLALGTGSITGGSNAGINVNNLSSVTLTYSGTITAGSGRPVSITNGGAGACPTATFSGNITSSANGILVQNCNSGTIIFSGASKLLKTTTNKAVALASNTGATINFTNGGLVDSTTTGSAFEATGGGTVSVTGTGNLLNSTTGVALSVTGTNIGASGLTFQSISSNGSTSGIVLNATGASGGLTVTGNGGSCSTAANCTGGAIQNTTSHGISLTNTTSPSFTRMFIQNNVGSGVRGDEVTNFTFNNGFINNSGTGGGVQESSIAFNDPSGSATNRHVSGTVTITGNTLTNARWHGVSILQFNGLLDDVNISNNILTSGTTTATGGSSLGSGIQLFAGGVAATSSSVTRAELNGNTITNFPGGVLIAVQCGTSNGSGPLANCGTPGNATNDIEIKNNFLNGGGTTSNGAGGVILPNQIVLVTVNGRGSGQFSIQNNGSVADALSGSAGNVIDISAGGATTVQATVTGNVINASGQTVSGVSGIAAGVGPFDVTGTGTLSSATLYATVQNNAIAGSAGSGIRLNVNAGDPTLNAIVTGNSVGAPISATYGIQIVEGNNSGFTGNANVQIANNTSVGGTGGGNTFPGIGLRKFGTASGEFNIVGLSPSPATNAQMESNVAGQNPLSASGTFGTGGVAAVNGSSNNWLVLGSVPSPP